ncbi:hypothetical protein KS4_31550 [Poriferisphaera corsica]|uniref:Uncharacterized protein n=1 Tax=Poriferisphaera corsica TaxID=2528020 RepID=A0A517YY00_9BACT|nr:hypothetical protein [Poriferisphaera corsica]QDU35077.1 hypothetical protein KS4_31550 [Poriferisphaera corsica]
MTTVRPGFFVSLLTLVTLSTAPLCAAEKQPDKILPKPTTDDKTTYLLTAEQNELPAYHTAHFTSFAHDVPGYNQLVLKGIDVVQASAPTGGGYFIGIKAKPTESPIGYDLALFNQSLLKAPRKTSYCSGSSYSAFIEGLNIYFTQHSPKAKLSHTRLEALRMQEPDGSRRDDGIKFWGHWNDDGFGNHFALVQYAKMGTVINPDHARPGDFMNISWNNGGGHSVIFLGYYADPKLKAEGKPYAFLRYWSSQGSTNGLADQTVPLSRIKSVKVVRLTNLNQLFKFNIKQKVNRKIPGDKITWHKQ